MILLDTNIVSEVMKPVPSRAVLEWLDACDAETLYLSTITIAEIAFGLHALPEGKRRQGLEDRFDLFVTKGFDQRVLTFDEKAAGLYGELMARRRRLGRPMSALDGQIAAIARAHGAVLATANVRDFEECGVEILNPFPEQPADRI